MPIGSRHDETGWIDAEGSWPVLRRDAGGRWRLCEGAHVSRDLLSRRVRVLGVRVGFDEL